VRAIFAASATAAAVDSLFTLPDLFSPAVTKTPSFVSVTVALTPDFVT
jgi:hypothetical protein